MVRLSRNWHVLSVVVAVYTVPAVPLEYVATKWADPWSLDGLVPAWTMRVTCNARVMALDPGRTPRRVLVDGAAQDLEGVGDEGQDDFQALLDALWAPR